MLPNIEERKRVLQEEEYGFLPERPTKVEVELLFEDGAFCARRAPLQKFLLKAEVYGKTVQFPFCFCVPKCVQKPVKTVVALNFESQVPNKYFPAEEIIDNGWAFACVCYKDVTDDSPTMDENAKILSTKSETGKLMMWAWAAMRILDYLQTRDDIDCNNVGVLGHSRLGKTALLTGAFDERFAFVHSNDSGSSGAALYRSACDGSEKIEVISRVFSYWFCKKFRSYANREKELPFDQHYLLSLIAPRVLSVGSAELDFWANPQGELDGARLASEAWAECGETGLIAPETAKTGVNYHDGRVGYYVRDGGHYFAREDWNRVLAFFEKHLR